MNSSTPTRNSNYWALTVSVLLTMMYFIAGMIFVSVPVSAFNWIRTPFPGFLVEQTLLVGSHTGIGWETRNRIDHLQQVKSIDGRALDEPDDFSNLLMEYEPGDFVAVEVINQEGSRTLVHQVELMNFPSRDFFRLFWLPFGIGFIYLVLGIGVAVRRGYSPSGQSFAYFCGSIAISTFLLFDLVTTHRWIGFWTTAVSQLGGAAILLGLTFPEPLPILKRYKWLAVFPIVISTGFSVWCLEVNNDLGQPWAYVPAWRNGFLYAVVGILIFFGLLIYRLQKPRTPEEDQQLRITLWGGFFAFSPALIWLASPFIGEQLVWDPALFLPLLMIFPVAIGAAIIRYRLWDLEVIINRTLVYSVLTLILGGVFLVGVLGSQLIFMRMFQQASTLSIAISSITVTLLFNPLRIRVQDFVDQRFFRNKYDITQALVTFRDSVQDTIELDVLTDGLTSVIQETMQPTKINLFTCNPGRDHPYLYIPEDDPLRSALLESRGVLDISRQDIDSPVFTQLRSERFSLVIPLVNQGELIGLINIGQKLSGQPYTLDDRRFLRILAAQIAPELRIANLVREFQEQVIVQERIRQELELARLIQQSLLPKQLPEIADWEIAVHYQPARAVGGDFYDFYVQDDQLVVVVGDVTDKGVPAALVMATTRSVLRGTARRRLSPGEALKQSNNILVPEMFQSMFVTCFYMIINLKSGQILFANAGHNPPMHRSGKCVEELMATGMPLGLFEDRTYEEHTMSIDRGDSILLFSDGLIEAHNEQREMFGEAKLKVLIDKGESPGELIETLKTAIDEHTGRIDNPEDDITLLCLRWEDII